MSAPDERSLAQFFFEIGYGACWAEAFIRSDGKPPFALTDAIVERAWEIAGEAHDEPAEFDSKRAMAEAAPAMRAALEAAIEAQRLTDEHVEMIEYHAAHGMDDPTGHSHEASAARRADEAWAKVHELRNAALSLATNGRGM